MSVLAFYLELGTDSEGRHLSDILAFSDEEMEARHDYIQWIFPLKEPSHYNRRAPILSHENIAAFHREPILRANLRRSFDRFLSFLGLTRKEKEIIEGPNFDARQTDVWTHENHNWRRITRVLASMSLLGCREDARLLYQWLRRYDRRYDRQKRKPSPFPTETMLHWMDAVNQEERETFGMDISMPRFQGHEQLASSHFEA